MFRILTAVVLVALAACSAADLGPARAPTTDRNPITGSRGGT